MSPAPLRGVFVTATDTEVGKTVLAAAICARLRADGVAVAAHKPAVTGLDDPAPPAGRDHELLAACTGQTPEEVCPRRYGPAVSPHLAAERAGDRLLREDLVAAVHAAAASAADRPSPGDGPTPRGQPAPAVGRPSGGGSSTGRGGPSIGTGTRATVVEGIGGLLVPFDRDGFDVRALAVLVGLPIVIAARPGLGTINHVRLTVEVARAAGLDVRAVVLTPWTDGDDLAADNRRTIGEATGVPVHVLRASDLTPPALADAAARLPVADWLG